MGRSLEAHLVYGYYLGSIEDNHPDWEGVANDPENNPWLNAEEDIVDALKCRILTMLPGVTPQQVTDMKWWGRHEHFARMTGLNVHTSSFTDGASAVFLCSAADVHKGTLSEPAAITHLYPSAGVEIKLKQALRQLDVIPAVRHPRWLLTPQYF